MDKKVTSILAYLSIILWLVGFLAGDKEGAKFHLNQGLVLFIASMIIGVLGGVLSVIPVISIVGTIVSGVGSLIILVFTIMGIISACKDEEKPLPLIGNIQILK